MIGAPREGRGEAIRVARFDTTTNPAYRPDIDGLRALAVIGVLAFHAFPAAVPGGFVGVDVFFVISGYLISGIILRGLAAGTFSYGDFYARRVRRIFPALVVVLAATLACGWYVLLSDELRQLGKHIVAGAGFVSNLLSWSETDYFHSDGLSMPLLHLWSLGIEEQFYLVWPPLLALTWKLGRRAVLRMLLLLTVASLVTNLAIVHRAPPAAFFCPLSRFWELTIGALLALRQLAARQGGRVDGEPGDRAHARAWLGVALVATGALLISEARAFPGWWAMLPTLGTALLISAGPRAAPNRYLLASRALVGVGRISYPLYLWHWPLLSFAHIVTNSAPTLGVRCGVLALSVALALATYLIVERPVRTMRGPRPIAALGGLAVANLAAGLAVVCLGLIPRLGTDDTQRVADACDEAHLPADFQPFLLNGRRYYQRSGAAGSVLFFGDSHVEQYAPRIDRVLSEHALDSASALFVNAGGCVPIPGVQEDQHPQCQAWRDDALALARRPDVDTVVVGACWNCYFIEMASPREPGARRGTPESYDYYFQPRADDPDARRYFRTGDGAAPALAALEDMLAALARTHRRVFLLLDNPHGKELDPKASLHGSRLTRLTSSAAVTEHRLTAEERALRERLRLLALRAGVTPLDPTTQECKGDLCPLRDRAGDFIYRDRNHVRPSFAEHYLSLIDVTVRAGTPIPSGS